jgi:hypothetical protein
MVKHGGAQGRNGSCEDGQNEAQGQFSCFYRPEHPVLPRSFEGKRGAAAGLDAQGADYFS